MMDFEVFIKAYSYRAEERKIYSDHELLIRICDNSNLSADKIFWLEEKFAAVNYEKPLELAGFILKEGNDKKEFSVTFYPPEEPYHDFWYLGVQLCSGEKIRFAIGNHEKYSFTDVLSLNFS
ncbi:MAG: hypothetical protein PUG60_07310 [Lachnospiraceae bacterium]|nr:hypothetical protein [Lachnospiraceae bacterium]